MNKPANRPRNRLLNLMRTVHAWLGIALFPLALIAGFTGFYLNHGKLFAPLFKNSGFSEAYAGASKRAARGTMLGLDEVLAMARTHWGEGAVERTKLKQTKGGLRYYVYRAGSKDYMRVLTRSGVQDVRSSYTRTWYGYRGERFYTHYYWRDLWYNLHVGGYWGKFGKLLVDIISIALLVFALSGAYLWGALRWRRWRSRRQNVARA